VDCGWRHEGLAWVATCACGWQSALRDYDEEALTDFRHHRMDVLGWTVVRPHPREH
jgi:hypothetical protein